MVVVLISLIRILIFFMDKYFVLVLIRFENIKRGICYLIEIKFSDRNIVLLSINIVISSFYIILIIEF